MSRLPGGRGNRSGPDRMVNQQETEWARRQLNQINPLTVTGTTQPRTLDERFSEVANVKDFGAKGDGTTDDAAAITAAFAIGKPVVFPPGTYNVNSTLVLGSNSALIGYGAKLSFGNLTLEDPVIKAQGKTNIQIIGLEIDGRKGNVDVVTEFRHAIALRSCTHVSLIDLYLHDNKGDGIYLGRYSGEAANEDVYAYNVRCDENHRNGLSITNLQSGRFFGCQFTNTDGTAPQAGVDLEPNYDDDVITDVAFFGCTSIANTGAGTQVLPRPTATALQRGIRFVECSVLDNGANGYHMTDAKDVVFEGGSVEGNGDNGVYLDKDLADIQMIGTSVRLNGDRGISAVISAGSTALRLSFIGCKVYDNSQTVANTNDGLRVAGTVTGLTVIGCEFGNVDGATQRYGLTTGAATVTNCRFIGNTASGATGSSILGDEAASRSSIGNIGIANAIPSLDSITATTATLGNNLHTGRSIEMASTSPGTAYIDFHADDTNYPDYALRLVRYTGQNGVAGLYHRGTGQFTIGLNEAAALMLQTSNNNRLGIASDGKITHYGLTASQRVETDANKVLVSKANAAAQADSVAGDVATLKVDFNSLLAKLRTAGLMAP